MRNFVFDLENITGKALFQIETERKCKQIILDTVIIKELEVQENKNDLLFILRVLRANTIKCTPIKSTVGIKAI